MRVAIFSCFCGRDFSSAKWVPGLLIRLDALLLSEGLLYFKAALENSAGKGPSFDGADLILADPLLFRLVLVGG